MNEMDKALRAAVQPVANEVAALDSLIASREAELRGLKEQRQRGRKVLAVLDPDSVARPARKKSHEISTNQLAELLGVLRENVNGTAFCANDLHIWGGVHQTTASKALKALHEQGYVRLDHMGGQRNTTKFFALIGEGDA